MPYKSVCGKCGAIRVDEQIGLEETPEEYIAKLVDVFREVRRVLRDDGTLWVNIADSYSKSESNNGGYSSKSTLAGFSSENTKGRIANESGSSKKLTCSCKPKDLIGIPWMLAFALRADGWYLRQDIIWAKPNPMPESVRDRCTKSHEYIFLLSKSKKYYYDNQAIMESAKYGEQHAKKATSWGTNRKHPNKPNVSDYAFKGDNHTTSRMKDGSYGRNKRSVWTVTTKPFKGAHFATFPPDLIEPCILAGSRIGGTVLDPFNGSGTTGIAAMNNGRNYVGIDLNAEYLEITRKRFTEEVQYATPLF
jgi:DNA modification methylase